MVKRYKGGLISATEATTSTTIASGMWSVTTAIQARKAGAWPSLLASEPPASVGGGGTGPTISNVSVTNSSYTVLDDTPYISTSGGYIKITGTGFVSGCTVYYGGSAATSTTFVSSTEVRAQIGASSSNTYMVYVVNPDSSTGILLNAITFSGTPSWVTGTTLSDQLMDVAFSIQLSATSDSSVTYSLTAGSSTPSGTTLYSNGAFAGTVTGLTVNTNYSFSVEAIDAENQDTARTFTVNIVAGDTYFNTTPLLLNGDIGNIWITDSSTNKFLANAVGDTRPTAFSPYNTNWSLYFPGATNYLTVGSNAGYNPGNTGAWTFECFVYPTSSTGGYFYGHGNGSAYGNSLAMGYASSQFSFSQGDGSASNPVIMTSAASYPPNQWYHFSVCKDSSNVIRMFVNGVQVGTQTYSGTVAGSGQPFINGLYDNVGLGRGGGVFYLSDVHWVVGTALYTSTPFTPPSGRITAVANTKILIGQSNRFLDTGTLAGNWILGGSPQISSFGRFTESDSTTGSAYFDGAGDFINYASNSAFALGTGDFTVESWIYITTSTSTYIPIAQSSSTIVSATNDKWFFAYNASKLVFNTHSSGGFTATTPWTLQANSWAHVAAVRASGTMRLFINGRSGTVSTTGTPSGYNLGQAGIAIGGMATPYYLTGYLTDFRIINGTAQYSANFTPATSSLSFDANTQVLTLQYRVGENNHRFIDESGQKNVITRAGQASQGSFSPFSPAGWSAYFDGTGDYLTVAGSSNLAFGTNDFTIECFVYYTSIAANSFLYDSRPNGTLTGLYPTIYNDVTAKTFVFYTNGAARLTSNANVLVANAWTHLVISRVSGTTRMFVNGTLQTATYADTNSYLNGATRPIVSADGNSQGSTPLAGYISNLRVLNGTGLYTANFTPATSSLTTVANVQLRTLQDNRFVDNSSNNYAITRNGDVKIQAFSPFRPSGPYTPATHGGSAYFDGTGDAVYNTTAAVTNFGADDFTVEYWVYPTASTSTYVQHIGAAITSAGLAFGTGTNMGMYATTSTVPIGGNLTVVVNQWNHIVWSRRSGFLRGYVNGAVGYSASFTTSLTEISTSIGAATNGSSYNLAGYISDIIVTKGNTIYTTASITVPTAPSSLTSNVSLKLSFTNGGIVDITGRQNFETAGNVTISNVQSKFGTGSLYFDGSGDFLTSSDPSSITYYNLRNNDFTVEAWIYPTATISSTQQIVGSWDSSLSWFFGVSGTNKLIFEATGGGTYSNPLLTFATSNSTLTVNAWNHVAITRSGNSFTLYINGSSAATATNSITFFNTTQGIKVGNNTSNQAFLGYIDDLRITLNARTISLPTSTYLTK